MHWSSSLLFNWALLHFSRPLSNFDVRLPFSSHKGSFWFVRTSQRSRDLQLEAMEALQKCGGKGHPSSRKSWSYQQWGAWEAQGRLWEWALILSCTFVSLHIDGYLNQILSLVQPFLATKAEATWREWWGMLRCRCSISREGWLTPRWPCLTSNLEALERDVHMSIPYPKIKG